MSTSRLVLDPSARSTPATAESRTQPTRTGTPAGRNPLSMPMNRAQRHFRDRPSGETSGQFRTSTRQLPAMPGSSRDHRPIRPGEHQRARRAPHGVMCTSTSIHHDDRAPVLGFKSEGAGPTSTRIELSFRDRAFLYAFAGGHASATGRPASAASHVLAEDRP
jgi:hypothetical protein